MTKFHTNKVNDYIYKLCCGVSKYKIRKRRETTIGMDWRNVDRHIQLLTKDSFSKLSKLETAENAIFSNYVEK